MNDFRILDITSNSIYQLDLGILDPVAYDDTGRYALGYHHFGDPHLLQEGQGLYLVDVDARQATFLRDIDADSWAAIWWDRYEQRFLIAGEPGLFSVTTDGTVTSNASATSRVPSPNGRFTASFDSAPRANWSGGLWLQTGDAEPVNVLDGGGLSLEWSPDSRGFFYDQGYPGLYLVVPETLAVIKLAERSAEVEDWQAPALDWQATWVSN